jgi:hypothetical protein
VSHAPPGGKPADLSQSESRLLHELIEAMRDIRYGSISLTIHEGRLVEVQKTKKIRVSSSGEGS